jgi:hypothetical protein
VVAVGLQTFAQRCAANRTRSPRACSSRRVAAVVVPKGDASVGQAEMREQAVAPAKGAVPGAANPASETQAAAQAQKLLADSPEKGRVKMGHRKRAAWARAALETRVEVVAAAACMAAAAALPMAADPLDHVGPQGVAAAAQTSFRTAGRPR